MSEIKTLLTDTNVLSFVESVEHDQRRSDALQLLDIFEQATGLPPAIWGDSIVGYGQYHYKSERSKQEGDWPLTGFSPRKAAMTVYVMPGFDKYRHQLEKLGKYTSSVSCIYFKRLDDIDIEVLKAIISDSVKVMKQRYPE